MLSCLKKTIKRIDTFQEDFSSLIFGLKHILGENTIVKEGDLIIKQFDEEIRVYLGTEVVLTEEDGKRYVNSKFSHNNELIEKAINLLEDGGELGPIADTGQGGVGGQQLGGMPIDKKKVKCPKCKGRGTKFADPKYHDEIECLACGGSGLVSPDKKIDEDGGTSVADISVNPNAFVKEKTKKRKMKEDIEKDIPGPMDGSEKQGQIVKGAQVKLKKVSGGSGQAPKFQITGMKS